jgi:hypothetical protein
MENDSDVVSGADKGPLRNVVFVDPCVITGHMGVANGTNTVFYFVGNCNDAITQMLELGSGLDAVAATPIVAQGGWDMERCYEYPGLELIRQFGERFKTVLWTHFAGLSDDKIAAKAAKAGVDYVKLSDGDPSLSALQVLDDALFGEEREVA